MKKFLVVLAVLVFAAMAFSADSVYVVPVKVVTPAIAKDSLINMPDYDTLFWVGKRKEVKLWIRAQGWPVKYLEHWYMDSLSGLKADSFYIQVNMRVVTIAKH